MQTFIRSIAQPLITIVIMIVSTGIAAAQATHADSTQAATGRDSIFRQMELKGVTVEGRTSVQKDDHTNYMPTKRQVDASNSGINLLARMMIPKLIVNLMDGTVKNADNSTPTIYIDNRKADATEADRLRPKDIMRVEYYDKPTAKFPGEQTVLNFITRKYDRGGYVDIRTTTSFFSAFSYGKYEAQAALDTKNVDFTLLAGTILKREDAPGTSGMEHYALQTPFTKQTTALEGLTKDRSHYGKLRATFRTEKTLIYADLGLNWAETPTDRHRTAVSYSQDVYPAAEAVTATRNRNATPSASFFMQSKVNGRQQLKAQAVYSHGDNTYRRTYTEGTIAPIINDTREKSNNIMASVQYDLTLQNGGTMTGFVVGQYIGSRATYTGTASAEQGIDQWATMAMQAYTQTFAKKLSLTLQVGPLWHNYNITGAGKTSLMMWRPGVTVRYAIKPNNSVSASWYAYSGAPFIQFFNTTEQRVNQYEVKRGNPELKMPKSHNVSLNYSLSLKNANISLFGQGYIRNDNSKAAYEAEGETLVGTYITDGKFIDYTAGGAVSMYLLGRSLQLSAQMYVNGQKLTGLYAQSHNRLAYSIGASYFIKSFSLYAQYVPKNGALQWGGNIIEWPHYYYLSASWHHKGWNVEASCAHVFEKNYGMGQRFDYGAYSFDNYTRINLNRSVNIKVSYSFDFGRKKVERTTLNVEQGSSSIMKL